MEVHLSSIIIIKKKASVEFLVVYRPKNAYSTYHWILFCIKIYLEEILEMENWEYAGKMISNENDSFWVEFF